MYAAVRIRGSVNVRRDVKDTLKMLKLTRVNQCVLLAETPSIKGMLLLSKDFITWGEIKPEVLEKLLLKRGKKTGKVKVEENEVTELSGKVMKEGPKKSGLNPVFKLRPPSGGYKSIKQPVPKGDLGYRKDGINSLLEKMI